MLNCEGCVFLYKSECIRSPKPIFKCENCPEKMYIVKYNHPIFVYGTLKKDFYNHNIIEDEEYIGKAITKNSYILLESSLPFVLNLTDSNSVQIHGEIYNVTDDTFKKLDVLEGHPNFYKREVIEVILDGQIVNVWIYFILPEVINFEIFHINNSGIFK